jgi:hypothetical protein
MTLLVSGCSQRMNLSNPTEQMNFGVRAAEMDLWREARFRFERAVQLDPNDPMALNNLAVACEGSGDFERARETYVKALRLDQSNQYIQKNYSRFMEFYSRHRKREAQPAAAVTPAPAPGGVSEPGSIPALPPITVGGEPAGTGGPASTPASPPQPPEPKPTPQPTPETGAGGQE